MNRPYLQYFILFTLLDCIFPFNSTDDSVKAQSSVETKCKVSHEGTCFRTTVESIIKITNVNNVARDIGSFFSENGQHHLKVLRFMSLCLMFTYV